MKFRPPELALLKHASWLGLPKVMPGTPPAQKAQILRYLGQIVTVVELASAIPLCRGYPYWRVKALDGAGLIVLEPCLRKLPPPSQSDEEQSETNELEKVK